MLLSETTQRLPGYAEVQLAGFELSWALVSYFFTQLVHESVCFVQTTPLKAYWTYYLPNLWPQHSVHYSVIWSHSVPDWRKLKTYFVFFTCYPWQVASSKFFLWCQEIKRLPLKHRNTSELSFIVCLLPFSVCPYQSMSIIYYDEKTRANTHKMKEDNMHGNGPERKRDKRSCVLEN